MTSLWKFLWGGGYLGVLVSNRNLNTVPTPQGSLKCPLEWDTNVRNHAAMTESCKPHPSDRKGARFSYHCCACGLAGQTLTQWSRGADSLSPRESLARETTTAAQKRKGTQLVF